MTEYHIPKTKYADFLAYNGEYVDIQRERIHKSLPYDVFKRKLDEVLERFKGRIFMEDRFLFDSQEDFMKFLRDYITGREIQAVVEHENKHIVKAEELGYRMLYGVWVLDDGFPLTRVHCFVMHTSEIKPEDARKIAGVIPESDPGQSLCDILSS